MRSHTRHIRSFLLLTIILLSVAVSSCKRPVYYSSTRVYNARAEQNKRLKKRGYSNQQYKKSNNKSRKWGKKNNFRKRQHKRSSSNKSGKK
jgi:predicted Holliday junction resolvase-like endonuclease